MSLMSILVYLFVILTQHISLNFWDWELIDSRAGYAFPPKKKVEEKM